MVVVVAVAARGGHRETGWVGRAKIRSQANKGTQ